VNTLYVYTHSTRTDNLVNLIYLNKEIGHKYNVKSTKIPTLIVPVRVVFPGVW